MIKARFGDRLDGWLEAALPFLFRHPVNPNLLTVVGTLVSVGAGVAFALGYFGGGAVLILVGGVFDLVDGVIARHHKITTSFGAFLDSTLDRLADMAILLGVMTYYADRGEAGTVLLGGVAMMASVLTSYAKARAEQFLPSFEGGFLERGERLTILGLGAVSGYMLPALWILAVAGTGTVAYRFAIAYREMARLDRPEETGRTPRMSERDPEDKGFTVIDRRASAGEQEPTSTQTPEADATRAAPRVDFSMLAQSIAFSALHYLGLMTESESGRTPERDLPLARHNIEILEVLEEKTRGNLSPEEAKLIASLLYEVRMHFVEATKSQGA